MEPPPEPSPDERAGGDATPGVPSRPVVLLAFCGVVAAGLLGGLAAYGIVDTASHGDDASASALAGVLGAVLGAIGAGIVAVLVLRARALWHVARDERPAPEAHARDS